MDFKNKRIGIIGGGSSAIQIIPSLQRLPGAQLSCFVRSKTWISRPFGDMAMQSLKLESTECMLLSIHAQGSHAYCRSYARTESKILERPRTLLEVSDNNRERLQFSALSNTERFRVTKTCKRRFHSAHAREVIQETAHSQVPLAIF